MMDSKWRVIPRRDRTRRACLASALVKMIFLHLQPFEHSVELRILPEISFKRDIVDEVQEFIGIDGIVAPQCIQRCPEGFQEIISAPRRLPADPFGAARSCTG